MLILLPVISFIGLVLLWRERLQHVGERTDLFYLLSCSLLEWVIFLYAVTEILSIWNGISNGSFAVAWSLFLVIVFAEWGNLHFRVWAGKGRDKSVKDTIRHFGAVSAREKMAAILLLLIGLSVLGLSLYTVPYNWDSMAYHLPRICHWEANGSVAYYATWDERQIYSPPLAEMVGLHIYMLSGHNWHLLNLVQTFSYLFCSAGIFSISKELGCSKRNAFLSTLIFMAMPIVFAEAISTQNDLFACVWLVIFVSEWVLLLKEPKKVGRNRYTFAHALIMGCCMGVAYLAKTSILIGMAVFLLVLLIVLFRNKVPGLAILISVVLAAAAAFILALPEMLRVYGLYGTISVSEGIVVGSIRPRYLFLNFLKNFFYNLPNRLVSDTTWVMFILSRFSALLCIDLNDSLISFNPAWAYTPADAADLCHDTAGNPLILWTILILVVMAVFLRIRKKQKADASAIRYLIASIGSFLLFCVILRWQTWGSRLMLPYLALLCPAAGVLLSYINGEKRAAFLAENTGALRESLSCSEGPLFEAGALGILLTLTLTSWISLCLYHFELEHEIDFSEDPVSRMYYWQEGVYAGDREICDYIIENGYTLIGLCYSSGEYEFPLWIMLDDQDVRIVHVLVTTVSGSLSNEEDQPDCIISKDSDALGDVFEYQGFTYSKALQTGGSGVLYVRSDAM